MDTLANALNCLMNAKRAGKFSCTIKPVSKFVIAVFEIMKKRGYIEYSVNKDNPQIVDVKIKNINKCGAIKPRFYAKQDEIMKYIKRYLPAREFGFLTISTSKGLMTHEDAAKHKIGGSIIAYCY